MSRVGKAPISVPDNVDVQLSDLNAVVSGKLGKLSFDFDSRLSVRKTSDKIVVSVKDDVVTSQVRALWGLTRSLINNMVSGVSQGFTKVLEINGVGYRANVKNNFLNLFLGCSHEIKYMIPKDVQIKCPKPTIIEITGCDKQKVGHIASLIRDLKKPEPYKGKGIRYKDELVLRKEGKKK